MYARILVAVDGSPGSARALTHAIDLGRACRAQLRLVHVVDLGWIGLGQELAVDTTGLAAARRDEGARILALAQEPVRNAGVPAECRLVELGVPGRRVAAQIVEEARTWPADLIVVGTHGRGGAERLLIGSVAEGVARRSDVPVLLVHG